MNFDANSRSYKAAGTGYHDRNQGTIQYGGFKYNQAKSCRNRSFMNNFESEFNNGYRPKYGFNSYTTK